MHTLEKMAEIVRNDPSVTVRDIAKRMNFLEQRSVYYWLSKGGFKGLRHFKRAVLSHRQTVPVTVEQVMEASLPAHEIASSGGSRRLVSIPVAMSVSSDGVPRWTQDSICMELPSTVSSSVFALKVNEGNTDSLDAWLVLDPKDDPQDGSYVLAIAKDNRRLVVRVISFGSIQRYFTPSGEEITPRPLIVGVLKARLEIAH